MLNNCNPDAKVSVSDRNINFTLPAVTLQRSLNDKVKKVIEEAGEVQAELDSETGSVDPLRWKNLTEEIIDTMISCQSALNHLAAEGVPVQEMIEAVYEKNNIRGYYAADGIPYVRDKKPSLNPEVN